MKKAMLAVLIPSLLGASSAFAGGIDLVKTDDIRLNFNGDIDLKSYYVTDNDGESAGTQTEVIFDDFDFDLTYKINDDLTFISGVDFTADGNGIDGDGESSETNDEEALVTDLIWVGFQTAYGQVQWGNLETSFDPLGIDNSEIYGGVASGDTDGGGTSHTNAIMYSIEIDDLWLSATYGIHGEDYDNTKITQMAWKYTPGDLQINGGVGQTIKYAGGGDNTEDAKATYAQIEVEYKFGDYTAAVLVSQEDEEINDIVTNGIEVDFTYKVTSKLKLSTGADFLTQDIDGTTTNDDFATYYVAGIYKFSSLVSLQMEIAQRDGDLQTFGKSSPSEYDGQTKAGMLLSLDF